MVYRFMPERISDVAHGQFVHVFVDRKTDKAIPIPVNVKTALESIVEVM